MERLRTTEGLVVISWHAASALFQVQVMNWAPDLMQQLSYQLDHDIKFPDDEYEQAHQNRLDLNWDDDPYVPA